MLHRIRFPLAALLWAAAVAVAPQAPRAAQSPAPVADPPAKFAPAEKIQIAGIRNAGRISESLYRGAQPKREGFAALKKLGITTIVDLRGERGEIAHERKEVEALGMSFVSIPSSGWSPPSDEHVAQFLYLLREKPGEKIFVHCRFGEDRTGVFIAAYRVAGQHWTADDALNEVYEFGFHGFWHPAMRSYVREFPARFASAPSFASLRSSLAEK